MTPSGIANSFALFKYLTGQVAVQPSGYKFFRQKINTVHKNYYVCLIWGLRKEKNDKRKSSRG